MLDHDFVQKNKNKTVVLTSTALSLVACQLTTTTAHDFSALDRVEYQCDEQVQIKKQQLDEQTIRIEVSGQLFELTRFAAPDKSQKYYSSEQGLQPEQGLLWIETEQSATLKSLMLDHTIKIEDYPVIYQCQQGV